MKEFIEKLIGRLEELRNNNIEKWKISTNMTNKRCHANTDNAYKDVIEIVNELAEEYNNVWIPCSERLPDNSELEYFLVWCKGYFTEGTHIGEECQWYGLGLLYNKNKWEVYQCKNIKNIEVIAWQPLPQPYKEEGVTNE